MRRVACPKGGLPEGRAGVYDPAMIRYTTAFLCSTLLCAGVLSCSGPGRAEETHGERATAFRANIAEAQTIVAAMDDDELVGQLLMIGIDGVSRLSQASQDRLRAVGPGAILLFGYNVSDKPAMLAGLLAQARDAAGVRGLPPFIAIDHEGGSVYRFKGGLTRLPSAQVLGAAGEEAARTAGRVAGSELLALGVTMNLAPVVEALSDANRAFLVDRVWSADPVTAGSLSAGFIDACQAQGVAACAKHFPGNGPADPHAALPVIGATKSELQRRYYEPFRQAINGGVAAIMLSHALVQAVDQTSPASLSAPVIAELKLGLGFSGIVLTDDLVMAALSKSGGPGAAAVTALSAGADMLMVSGGPAVESVRKAVSAALADGRLPRERLTDAATRIVAQKLRFGLASVTEADRESRLAALEQTVSHNRAALAEALAH